MRRALIPLALLVALVASWPFWGSGERGRSAAPERAAPAAPDPSGERKLLAPPDLGDAAPAAREELAVAAGPEAAAPPDAATGPNPDEAVVRGRLLLPGGAPAAGVPLALHGWTANAERVAEHGLPESWSDVEGVSAGDGRFELRFVPPQAYQFTLDGHLSGNAPVGWRWSGFAEGQERDVGTVELVRGGAIEVAIERPDGSPPGTDWRVHADGGAGDDFSGREGARRTGEHDPARGTWLVTDMPPGPAEVAAYSRIANWIDGGEVEVVAGETVPCTLVYDGPANDSRIVVTVFTGPIYPVEPEPANVMLTGGPLAEPLRCERTFGSQSHDFPDLAPGEYTVVIDDPSFDRWERSGVRPGQRVDAELSGNAAVRVEVVDRDTGNAVTNWSLSIRCEGVNFGPNVFPLVVKGTAPPADPLFDSLVPLDYMLLLDAPGYPTAQESVSGLTAGEERLVRFELSERGGVAGTVVWEEAGTPVAGARVELYRAAIRDRNVEWWTIWGTDRKEQHLVGRTIAGGDGRYRVPTSAGGPLLLRAVGGPGLHVLHELQHAAGEEQTGVELAVPASAHVAGRVLAPPGVDLGGLVARLGSEGSTGDVPAEQWEVGWDEFLEEEVAADGTFRLGPLKPGGARLALLRTGDPPGGGSFAPRALLERTLQLEGPGEHAVELDLVDTWPGELVVALRVDGEPAGPLSVSLRMIDGETPRWGIGTRANAGGIATLHPLAGTYRVVAREPGNWWSLQAITPVQVNTGERTELVFDVPAARGELRVLDGTTGTPLASGNLRLLRVDANRPNARAKETWKTTDAEGRIELLAPLGTMWVLRRDTNVPLGLRVEDVAGLPRVEWTASGPAPAEVSVP